MDPALHELLVGEPEDVVPVIVRLREPSVVPPGLSIVAQFGSVASCRIRRGSIVRLRADDGVLSMKAPRDIVPERDIPTHGVAEQNGRSWSDARRPPFERATGAGVVIGVVDFGFDVCHPELRLPGGGGTRISHLWAQGGSGKPPHPYGYGAVYTASDINRALASDDPYAALGINPADADPGNGSHGTHVAAIAAGTGVEGPIGIAPNAECVCVDLSSSGVRDLASSTNLFEAVHFVAKVAEGRSCAINLSLGNMAGPHDGLTALEMALDEAVTQAPGLVICQSNGNYYSRSGHTANRLLPGDSQTLVWHTDAADVTPNEMEIWYPGVDVFEVEVRTPIGQSSGRIGLGARGAIAIDGREVLVAHNRAFDPLNGKHHVDIFMKPGAPAGSWEVELRGLDVADGRYHAWIERDSGCPDCQSFFDPEIAVRSTTTGTICNGQTIAVGAYDAHSPEPRLAEFSSVGPTVTGQEKPALVAPGVRVLSARSTPRGGRPGIPIYARKSGSSMAAPHVTGTVALMLSAAPRPLWAHEVKALLSRTATPVKDPIEGARWGAGILDSPAAVDAARHVSTSEWTTPSITSLPGQTAEDSQDVDGMAPAFAHSPTISEAEGGAPMNTTLTSPLDAAERLLSSATEPVPSEILLDRILPEAASRVLSDNHSQRLTSCTIFNAVSRAHSDPSAKDVSEFEIVASPGARLDRPLASGDLILNCALGELAPGHTAVVASPALHTLQSLSSAQLVSKWQEPGLYVHVVHGSPTPRVINDAYAMRVAGVTGRLPLNEMIIRLRHDGTKTSQTTMNESRGADFLDSWEGGQIGSGVSEQASPAPDRPDLRRGSRHPAVTELQLRLRATLGNFNLNVDGIFGADTHEAVRRFQERHRLPADGVVGQRTWAALLPMTGGVAADERQQQRLNGVADQASNRAKAADFSGALDILMGLYADPVLADKPESRGRVAFTLGNAHHSLREFDEAVRRYTEAILAAGDPEDLAPLALERIREARLGLAPTAISVLRERRARPVSPSGSRAAESVLDQVPQVPSVSDSQLDSEGLGSDEQVLHACRDGEGPAGPEPDPTGRDPHPVIDRGTSLARSRRPTVGFAQQCLNNFLDGLLAGNHTCAAQTVDVQSFIDQNIAVLRSNGQLPLTVDCRFGQSTQAAVKAFQACIGLDRDGIVGRMTWSSLERFAPVTQTPTRLNPPDTETCGVPSRPTAAVEQELDSELANLLEETTRRGVRAHLSLFQNSVTTSHRNHFQCQASRTARDLSAYASPRADRCTPRRIGPTPYDSGQDILSAISAVHTCLGRRVASIHVFGHSGSNGIFGTIAGTAGLYRAIDSGSRSDGGRQVTDVPVDALAEDVVFVLHGCNLAAGPDNLARALFEHLAAALGNPRVFGHHNSGCAGRDNSWREYSSRHPAGRNRRSIAPYYSGDGCCT